MTPSRPRAVLAVLSAASALVLLAGCAGGSGATESADPEGTSSAASDRDLAAEEANRELVLDFYEGFFDDHEIAAADVVAEEYIQHNPNVPDGRDALIGYFEGYFQENPESGAEVMRTATDGDLVYVHSNFTESDDDLGDAVVDIFRVEDGQIVEHWDVVQEVPAESANDNTMF